MFRSPNLILGARLRSAAVTRTRLNGVPIEDGGSFRIVVLDDGGLDDVPAIIHHTPGVPVSVLELCVLEDIEASYHDALHTQKVCEVNVDVPVQLCSELAVLTDRRVGKLSDVIQACISVERDFHSLHPPSYAYPSMRLPSQARVTGMLLDSDLFFRSSMDSVILPFSISSSWNSQRSRDCGHNAAHSM